MRRFRTVFMGTPDFAVPCLEKLADAVEIIGVVTQPDKPSGRKRRLTPPPVKTFALGKGLSVEQPMRIKSPEFTAKLREMHPELIVVTAFGQILSQEILDIPFYGCINVHASLLPRYRGAAPISWAIIRGEKTTGVTTMFMDAGLDTGDMLLKAEAPIDEEDTAQELHDRLMGMGANLLMDTLEKLSDGTLERTKQEDSQSSYAPMLTKETGRIDWARSAEEIHNLVRGLNPWPVASSALDGKKMNIWRTRVAEGGTHGMPGEIVGMTHTGILVATGEGAVEILELQASGGKRMASLDYARGHGLQPHMAFACAQRVGAR